MLTALLLAIATVTADPIASLDDALVIQLSGPRGRVPFRPDAVEAQIASGTWSPPRAGDPVVHADGATTTWGHAAAGDNGWLAQRALRNGYALWAVDDVEPGVAMLHASGHSLAYVNGEPRAGDPYRNGWVRLPVRLTDGENRILFRASRGGVRATLERPRADVFLDPIEATLPDLRAGESAPVRAGIILVNATEHTMHDLIVRTSGDGIGVMETRVRPLGPLATRKVPIWIAGHRADDVDAISVRFEVIEDDAGDRRTHDTITLPLSVRSPAQTYKRTFESAIDGSVQYYAVTPATGTDDDPGLILTLHGAGVEGLGQARVYRPKSWAHVVAPTNRRPFGFDWEDWGRLDAMEVLDHARHALATDAARTWLTGHSMGGHGTWHLGVTFPGEWAAIGPSAGWESFWSYAGGAEFDDADAVQQVFERATAPSRTLGLTENLLDIGVYVLHGDADDNVPVDQARRMRSELESAHPDFAYHEQPGAGHWWGDQCCDWPAMMEFMQERERVARDRIRFATMHPGVSATSGWVTLEQQLRPLQVSRIDAAVERGGRGYRLRTENVAGVALRVEGEIEPGPIAIEIDGQSIVDVEWPAVTGVVRVLRGEDGTWSATGAMPSGREKGPHRAGPFKDAFRNQAALVYGTAGTPDENAWSYAKARFDAETFWYRGNGAFEVISDVDFLERGGDDRNVILYGNGSTNAAWDAYLRESPIEVERGRLRVGEREFEGDAWAAVFVRPHPRSPMASVGVVAGTGAWGLRLTDRLPYFVSGVAYPDWVVFGPSILEEGVTGVEGAGFFGNDWGLESGEAGWRNKAGE